MKKIKNRCASCGRKIPGTKEHYEKYGNYCKQCVWVSVKLIKLKISNPSEEETKRIRDSFPLDRLS